jgi:hypothetical protein
MSASREHWRSRALVNAGNRIRRLKAEGASEEVVRANQREVFRQAAVFLAELLGPDVHYEILSSEHPTDFAAQFLHAVRPIFPSPPAPNGVFWAEVIGELGRLSFGDEPELLKPQSRLPGQRAKPAYLAQLRLNALEWAEFFRSQGLGAKDYQPAIQLAFGSDWDAIRHWKSSITKVLGEKTVARALSYAPDGFFVDWRKWHRSIADPLEISGDSYRREIGLQSLPDEVIHGEWEKLTRSLSVHFGPPDF